MWLWHHFKHMSSIPYWNSYFCGTLGYRFCFVFKYSSDTKYESELVQTKQNTALCIFQVGLSVMVKKSVSQNMDYVIYLWMCNSRWFLMHVGYTQLTPILNWKWVFSSLRPSFCLLKPRLFLLLSRISLSNKSPIQSWKWASKVSWWARTLQTI